MHGAAELRVPLEVNLSFGDTWADAKGDRPASGNGRESRVRRAAGCGVR